MIFEYVSNFGDSFCVVFPFDARYDSIHGKIHIITSILVIGKCSLRAFISKISPFKVLVYERSTLIVYSFGILHMRYYYEFS